MKVEPLPSVEPAVFQCSSIGSVHGTLAQSQGRIGRVINVFDTTINIRTDGDELLVLTLGKTKSPINVNVVGAGPAHSTGFAGLARQGSDAVRTKCAGRTMIQAGRVLVSIDRQDIFQNSLDEPAAEALRTFASASGRVSSALAGEAEKGRTGCLLRPDITTAGLLNAFSGRLLSGWCDTQDGMAEALAGLCGRGPGFTPAGDDFIAGYLAMFNWLCSALELGPPIIPGGEFLRLTTWTSFKLMEYSARDLLDEQAQSMLNSVAGGRADDYVRCIEVIGKRGHTSGIDFATGATFGLYTVADSVCGTRSLGDISGRLGITSSGPQLS
ncbi:oxamate carbamoyltransferase subunit AllH family protein [Nitrososphaera viennensis]|uniref:DUF2877 domain-containing protein n=2 Tax=Nitrososphaera viennensis TaxID=1034015 RepID=A0A060HK08_9ARCH|nr:DUF2877 domain-containing protein [Nitrososphaera viennensis]AIC15848.1 hypothetical protein NVIE_015960 [Nitrososphaera viennensis EN76]UVS67837.1 DUF2877 domain-containing protein [Nitrososphaera viennensis]